MLNMTNVMFGYKIPFKYLYIAVFLYCYQVILFAVNFFRIHFFCNFLRLYLNTQDST
jgi:hypothetical protein